MLQTTTRVASIKWVVHAVCLVLFLVGALVFARSQEIWVDETTQLSGLTLGPVDVVHWLTGEDRDRFGVPGDRMPPLSYWLGWGWSQLTGGVSESSMRAMGVVAVAAALVLLIETAWTAFGVGAAWLTGLWFGVAPTVLTASAEVRAYPLLILGSAVACWGLQRLATVPAAGALRAAVVVSVACMATSYCHFFGVVLFGAATLATTYICVRRGLGWAGPVCLVVVFGVTALGLIPFLTSAVEMSGKGAGSRPLFDVLESAARLVYRLSGGHPVMGAFPLLVVLVPLTTLGCLAIAAAGLLRRSLLFGALALAVISGFGAATLVQLGVSNFDAHTVSYNSWMLPPVALMVGASAAVQGKSAIVGSQRVLSAVLLAAVVSSAGLLLAHAPTYAHGAAERVEARLRAKNAPDQVTVVHDAVSDWGFAYFPLRYSFAGQLRQYLTDLESGHFALSALPDREQRPFADLRGQRIAVLTTRMQHTEDLAKYLAADVTPSFMREELRSQLLRQGCRVESTEAFVAFMATQIDWLVCE